MYKNINIRDIPEPIYYKTIELKGKLKAKNWVAFLEKVIEAQEKKKCN
jgi:hypothetical protein